MKWQTVSLGEIATIVGGSTPSRSNEEFWNGDILWVTPSDLPMPGEEIAHVTETANQITKAGFGSCSAQLLPIGTVLFSSRATIGKLGIAKIPLVTNPGFANFIPKPCIDGKFLAYTLQYHTSSIAMLAGSTTFQEVNKGALKRYRISLPSLSEQRRIVELLDQADALRKKHAEADAKANRVHTALFHKMFGDPAANPKGWAKAPLAKLLQQNNGALQSGPFGTHLHNSDFVEEGTVLAVGIDNVHDSGFQIGRHRRITYEKFQQLKKYKLDPGDILITIMGTIGRTCVFPEWAGEAICTKHVYRIQIDRGRLEPEYLCASIRFSSVVHAQLGASVTGQIVNGITSKDLKELVIDVPPLSLQQLFSQTKALLDCNAPKRAESKQQLIHLFSVLLRRAFSGALTAKWRETHMQELLTEMEEQAKAL
jgi:type I restriction enzyme S subunit